MSAPVRRGVAIAWLATLAPVSAALLYAVLDHGLGLTSDGHAAVACFSAPLLVGLGARTQRTSGLAVLCLLAGGAAGGLGLGGLGLGLGLFALALGGRALAARMAAALPGDPAPLPRAWRAWWRLGLVIAVLQMGRMASFLADPSLTWGSMLPGSPDIVRHACLTSYVHGVVLAERGLDPYDPKFDPVSKDFDAYNAAPLPETAAGMAPFTLDLFGYTPGFLLLPRAMMALSRDFLVIRPLFAWLSLLAWTASLWYTARALGGRTASALLWLTPLASVSVPIQVCLQFGNAGALLTALTTAAWLAIRAGRPGVAGSAIAFATFTRYTPALLGLVVLLQRRWRVVAVGALASAALVAAPLLLWGPAPWRFFVETELPAMASGQVMRFLDRDADQIAPNAAIFSLPFKLTALGIGHGGWAEAQSLARGFTLVLLALSVLVARARGDDRHQLILWTTLTLFGSLQSNFAGPHVLPGAVLALLLLAPELRGRRQIAAFAVAFLLCTASPHSFEPRLMLLFGLLQTGALLIGGLWLILRAPRALEPAP